MSDHFLQLVRSEETEFLLEHHPNAFLLLTLIAKRARRKAGHPDGLKPGQCYIGDYRKAGIQTRQKYRTALDFLIMRATIKIVETCRTRKKSTTGTTTVGTLVELLSSTVYDINLESNNHQHNHRATTEQPPNNHEQESKERNKKAAANKKILNRNIFETKEEELLLFFKNEWNYLDESTRELFQSIQRNKAHFEGGGSYADIYDFLAKNEFDYFKKTLKYCLKNHKITTAKSPVAILAKALNENWANI